MICLVECGQVGNFFAVRRPDCYLKEIWFEIKLRWESDNFSFPYYGVVMLDYIEAMASDLSPATNQTCIHKSIDENRRYDFSSELHAQVIKSVDS